MCLPTGSGSSTTQARPPKGHPAQLKAEIGSRRSKSFRRPRRPGAAAGLLERFGEETRPTGRLRRAAERHGDLPAVIRALDTRTCGGGDQPAQPTLDTCPREDGGARSKRRRG